MSIRAYTGLYVPACASSKQLKPLNCTGGRRTCICDVLCSMVEQLYEYLFDMALKLLQWLYCDDDAVKYLHGQGAPTASGCFPSGRSWQTRRTMKRRGRWLLSGWTFRPWCFLEVRFVQVVIAKVDCTSTSSRGTCKAQVHILSPWSFSDLCPPQKITSVPIIKIFKDGRSRRINPYMMFKIA